MTVHHRVDAVDTRELHPTLLAALHEEQILEASGDEKSRRPTATSEKRVEDRRGAVTDHLEAVQEFLAFETEGLTGHVECGDESRCDVVRGGRSLAECILAGLRDHEAVRECSADVRITDHRPRSAGHQQAVRARVVRPWVMPAEAALAEAVRATAGRTDRTGVTRHIVYSAHTAYSKFSRCLSGPPRPQNRGGRMPSSDCLQVALPLPVRGVKDHLVTLGFQHLLVPGRPLLPEVRERTCSTRSLRGHRRS